MLGEGGGMDILFCSGRDVQIQVEWSQTPDAAATLKRAGQLASFIAPFSLTKRHQRTARFVLKALRDRMRTTEGAKSPPLPPP